MAELEKHLNRVCGWLEQGVKDRLFEVIKGSEPW